MSSRGMSLIEVLVALAVLGAATLGIAQLLAAAMQSIAVARVQTLTVAMAAARIEQLRALTFAFDDAGQRLTEQGTDLSTDPAGAAGSGLTPSPAGALSTNHAGFVDFLDRDGRWVGNGASAPPHAVFVRRWSIEPSGGNGDRLVLQVLVRPLAGDGAAARRVRGEARFVTVIVREAR